MSIYLTLQLYEPGRSAADAGGEADLENGGGMYEDGMSGDSGNAEERGSSDAENSGNGAFGIGGAGFVSAGSDATDSAEKPKKLLRSIKISLVRGLIRISSVAEDITDCYTADLNEQLTNEFLIQVEMLDIKKWNPIKYSPAYVGTERCSWVLEFSGLKGESTMHSGDDTYPKEWPVLIDLIDAFNDMHIFTQESVRIAAGMMDETFSMPLTTDSAGRTNVAASAPVSLPVS